jgi:uncharacterized C2H2 Zn-finger protein
VEALRIAINKRDEPGFWQAYEKVRPWQRNMRGVTITYKAIGKDWAAAQSLYADLMSELTQNVRLILWQPEKGQLRPALYCPDLKTAKFVLLLMGRIRVCPRCKEIFRPKKDNVIFCRPAHGVAWRTALSRARAKAKKEQKRARKSLR